MDQKKIGFLIKKIRLDNNLTQKEFADKYNVSFQAVSKWERGFNLPDVAILKQIADDFHLDVNELLDGTIKNDDNHKKNNKKKKILIIIGIIVIISLIVFVTIKLVNKEDFQFKTLSSNCSNFDITGSIAYNSNKSYIYITDIKYCGTVDNTKYQSILCTLYDEHGNIKTELGKYDYQDKDIITLEDFLKNSEFKIDYFSKSCKYYQDNSIYLEIIATDLEDKTIYYKIPLGMNDCK